MGKSKNIFQYRDATINGAINSAIWFLLAHFCIAPNTALASEPDLDALDSSNSEAPLRIEKLGPILGTLQIAPHTNSGSKSVKADPSLVRVGKKPHCSGVADYYAERFHGMKTASGQIHDKEKFTAAHRSLPFGTKLKVVNRHTGKACIVTVNDRGPFTKSRIIDLSAAAARELGLPASRSRLVDCYLVEE